MTPGAAIFDVDGTLVDSNDAHARAWVAALAAEGIAAPYDVVRRAIGMGGDKLLHHVAGIDEASERGRRVSALRQALFRERELPNIRAFDGGRALATRLIADGYVLAVASSAKAEELRPLLERAGVASLIALRTSADDADESKPDPDIVKAALGRTGMPAARAIMLGDTPYDVEAARRAGVTLVAVESGGWTAGELAGAIAVYRDVAHLLAEYETSVFARPTAVRP